MRGSIRFRITMIATLITATVLAVASVAVVVVVERQLTDNLDRSLQQRADQVAANWSGDANTAIVNSNDEDRFVQVVAADGSILASSTNLATAERVADLPTGNRASTTHDDIPIEDDSYRVLVQRAPTDVGDIFIVVGENVDDVVDGVRALALTLGVVVPLAMVALAVVTWWLVGRTLRPVEAIRREVAEIGLAQLDHRVPVPEGGDEVGRLAAQMNDMLARLESSSERQRRFVADASHELRTPLTRMRTALEVDLADPHSDFAATSRHVLQDAIEMQHLVDDLLFLARWDASSSLSSPSLQTLDLDVIVHAEVRRVREDGDQLGDVAVDMGGVSAAMVVGDANQLTRLVRNLLTNAIRHARSRVEIGLAESDTDVELTVADDGVGIPLEDRAGVFERFVRVDEARSDSSGGAGLGLAIVREIVAGHGGTVSVGEADLGGALLTVRLPAPRPG